MVEGTVSGKPDFVANGNVEVEENADMEERIDDVNDKKWEQIDGAAKMEEDKRGECDDGNIAAQDMDVHRKEVNKIKEVEDKVDDQEVVKEGDKGGKEESVADEEKQEDSRGGKEETKSRKMEEDFEETTKKETQEEKQAALGGGGEEETMIQKMEDGSEDTTKKEPNQEKQESSREGAEMETKSGKIEENSEKETEGKVEEGVDSVKDYEEKREEPKEEKGSNKRHRIESTAAKMDKTEKMESEEKSEDESKTKIKKRTKKPKSLVEKERKEQRTPTHSTTNRPVRERKSVKRLVASMEKDTVREFHIEKGRGTALKDIPNVASKLSRKKNDDTFKSLHTILFARRGKASLFKNNISRFSGFLWHDDEEKQMIKLKEKLDKYMKEKLVEFCDVLDIPISSANHTRKEEIIVKLIEFLVEPHATTSELLAEKEQFSKGKRRKRAIKSASGSTTPSKVSSKSRRNVEGTPEKSGETNITPSESENETKEEMAHTEEEYINGVSERSEDERAESEDEETKGEEESDEDKGKQKQAKAKSCGKEQPAQKSKTKKVAIYINSSHPAKNTPAKLLASRGENNDDKGSKKPSSKKKDESMVNSSGKKKDESIKKSSQKESASKENNSENRGKEVLEGNDEPKEVIFSPSKEELRSAICEILKEADFNTATFIDILKLLAKRFDTDLTPTKLQIKLMVMDELKKLAEEDEGEQKPSIEAVNTA